MRSPACLSLDLGRTARKEAPHELLKSRMQVILESGPVGGYETRLLWHVKDEWPRRRHGIATGKNNKQTSNSYKHVDVCSLACSIFPEVLCLKRGDNNV